MIRARLVLAGFVTFLVCALGGIAALLVMMLGGTHRDTVSAPLPLPAVSPTAPTQAAPRDPLPTPAPTRTAAWRPLTVFQANTHVGHAIGPALAAQIRRLDPDVVLLSEVSTAAKFDLLRRLVGADYEIVPNQAHLVGPEATQTPIAFKRTRFTLVSESNRQISPWLGGGPHDALHPTRFLTRARLVDRTSGRMIDAYSVHTWAAWAERTNPQAHVGHLEQVSAFADSIAQDPAADVVVAGGDWNENLNAPLHGAVDSRVTLSRVGVFNAARMLSEPAVSTVIGGATRPDDLFYRRTPFLAPVAQRIVRVAGGSDHLGVLTRLKVLSSEAADQ